MNWMNKIQDKSLSEVNSSIDFPKKGSFLKKLFAYTGPGLMVAVGYMDPGNWATNIAGGAQFGYTLLSVILLSNLCAILLQHLALKLGVVSGMDLAQACRANYSKPVNIFLWILCEVAIAACDLAELVGAALALNLLFRIPMLLGVIITLLDVFILLYLQNKGFRKLEALVATLILTILGCFIVELIISKPDIAPIIQGFLPTSQIIFNPNMLFIAIGILGATVMPHNLYLHSSIVQTRKCDDTEEAKKEAIKFATIDSTLSLIIAFFINAFILILAAKAFHFTGYNRVGDIHEAYHLLDGILGVSIASTLFGVALLASGQNATLTGTLAGQIVMEGFLNIRLKPWLRRLITRLIAVVPAFIVIFIYGESSITELLVFSQVILSMQLSFAIFPLVAFTSCKSKMGNFTNGALLKYTAWTIAFFICGLNVYLLINTFTS